MAKNDVNRVSNQSRLPIETITPLFLSIEPSANIEKNIVTFNTDKYNQAAKNNAEAISTFLREYRNSPTTLLTYAKEIERLLLWCIYIGKTNVSNLNRDHLVDYQEFIKKPST